MIDKLSKLIHEYEIKKLKIKYIYLGKEEYGKLVNDYLNTQNYQIMVIQCDLVFFRGFRIFKVDTNEHLEILTED